MAYVATLKASPYWSYLSPRLHDHLNAEDLEDVKMEYSIPPIDYPAIIYKEKGSFLTKPTDVRLPSRLASPLIPYPSDITDYFTTGCVSVKWKIHGHHMSQIQVLLESLSSLKSAGKIPRGEIRFDMDSLKRFARMKFSAREDLINLSTLAFAERATCHDLSIAAGRPIKFSASATPVSLYTSFIIMIQRLRVHIAKCSIFPTFDVDHVTESSDEATYTMFDNGMYLYKSNNVANGFVLAACGGHFAIYHASLGYWFHGPSSYLDYIFTMSDILNNLDVLKNCDEYDWAVPMFNLMISFSEHEGHHQSQVEFMKGMEGFLLNMSDYDENYAMNWKPILEAVNDLWKLDMIISGVEYDLGLPLSLLRGGKFSYPKKSYFCRFIIEGLQLTRQHLQEISALHKLIFYAEVDSEAGVMKFLERVHTPRNVDSVAVKNITRLAKCLFLISYRKKHFSLPNLIAPFPKQRLLETYSQKSSMDKIAALPLSWWDEVKVFDCMDNTLTDDPLEFAKDKGALKDKISFGPGDSRKELLQVIERQKYELKDFFRTKRIAPKPCKITISSQKHTAEYMEDPARLIEKEREQKIKARLFANGELSNKHSLSLVAARMKKALSYFDEQLMTPTDKKRKALIHEASRELAQRDNYSLLLDIEGHNQSMQASNTAELAEFMGHLFGEEGWGALPHYFSQLNVYHYDEYIDKVTESNGQLGGIEGWLNPFWTLHTTLMMKLLRIMTDLSVKTIMVYSDDVDAILNINQASEAMVQSVFNKIMTHCSKFGMTVKYSQTNLSKHRITMLRQHYADGIRADSTLKRLLSVSAGNNPVLVSDELEVAGICSSASSALELSNHNEACSYLKNYKLGLLLCRLPQMILSRIHEDSMISPRELPKNLSNLLYYSKDDQSQLVLATDEELYQAAKNDIAMYLGRNQHQMDDQLAREALGAVYGTPVSESRLVDSPDRVLYLQVYDTFIQDLLFFWIYLPSSLGGLGGSLHLNLILSGHSVGLTKSLHYIHNWVSCYSVNTDYFLRYLSVALSITDDIDRNYQEQRLVTSNWPGDTRITPAVTSVQQSIKSAVRRLTRNLKVKEMFELSDDRDKLAINLVEIFRNNFHTRIVQFYHENTSVHFVDLLISKIETSSGLLLKVKNITRLRNSICSRNIENIRLSASTQGTLYFELTRTSDVVQCLLTRKQAMFPKVQLIPVEEILYDDKVHECNPNQAMITVRRCAPTHFRNGIRVYDDPKVGNETLYKGDLIDDDRMLGHKEELLAAKLVAVTKWFLTKYGYLTTIGKDIESLDVYKACNLSLSTLTDQTFKELFPYSPTETGGEILHRIPNLRFSTSTYVRAEMNRSLNYTTEMNQRMITGMGLIDSNVNFDYLRMRLLVMAMICDKRNQTRRLVVRYNFTKLTGVKDVQFVKPCPTTFNVSDKFKCYAALRGHTLSKMRFRYLANSYLYLDNVSEWAVMPKLTESETAEVIGTRYINDIILRYSRDLDKDYMLIDKTIISPTMWHPLITKLNLIDKNWRNHPDLSVVEEIAIRLSNVLHERKVITSIDKTDHIQLALQSSCLQIITEDKPDDVEMLMLIDRYSKLSQHRRHSTRLSIRLAQYQAMISSLSEHKSKMAMSLILEYIVCFHFKVHRVGNLVEPDADCMLEEFDANRLTPFSMMIVNPELQVRILILGYEFVEEFANTHQDEIRNRLVEVCDDVSLDDVIMPTGLPSLSPTTTLTGSEQIPAFLMEIEYIEMSIPDSALSTLGDARGLFRYAHRCSTSGSRPEAFFSHTGSDSLGAQLGLFRLLQSVGMIGNDTSVCDLTAGRGDGVYAANHLGINTTAYSLADTFTRVLHHPLIQFKDDYDIFKGETLKFLTGFDHIHIDVSFSGGESNNILDLVLLLQRLNLTYSIRMNSVIIDGYTEEVTCDLPSYSHSLAYCMNSTLKPYQIYLIGKPTAQRASWTGPHIKDSIAFKSMALAYSQLLNPSRQYDQLTQYQPNSLSVYMPHGSTLIDYISAVCENSLKDEQRYYLKRYAAEIGKESYIYFSYDCLTHIGHRLLWTKTRTCKRVAEGVYEGATYDSIGNVSEASLGHHKHHVDELLSKVTQKCQVPLQELGEDGLTYFRIHHPLQYVRGQCNIMLGLLKFCRGPVMSGHDALVAELEHLNSSSRPPDSMHQREITMAIKLLVMASKEDDYSYGSRYCHKLLIGGTRSAKSIERILRAYRLLSYAFYDIRNLMFRGYICIRSLDAISNELEVRERAKFKYKPVTESLPMEFEQSKALDHIINDSIDELFRNLDNFASALIDPSTEDTVDTDLPAQLHQASLSFEMDVGAHVDIMVEKLKLKPSGPFGIIDLGDDPIYENDDW